MKVAIVCPYDYAYPGGVAIHIANLYEELKKVGHEVRIITPYSGSSSAIGSKDIIPIGRPVPVPSGGSIARVTLSPILASPVRAIMDRENFDIIHLHEPLCSTLTLTTLHVSNTVNVGTFHACHKSSTGYQIISPFIMGLFKKLHGKIAVSKPAKDFVSRYFPGEYRIIPNGVDIARFSHPTVPIADLQGDKLNILFVGRLEKRKGLIYLLKAFKIVKRELPNTRLVVVGPGEHHHFEKLAQKENLSDVFFTGYVTNEELPAYYHAADVFCSPATGGESFGIILLEAMSVGKPVVASAIDGYASVMTDGAEGLLVPPKDDKALSAALIKLLKDEPLRREMGNRGKDRAQECSWPNVAEMVNDYYNSVIQSYRPKR